MTIPLRDREASLIWGYYDPEIQISTSDERFARLLERRGWRPESDDGDYQNFRIPHAALTIRSRKTIEGSASPKAQAARAANLARARQMAAEGVWATDAKQGPQTGSGSV